MMLAAVAALLAFATTAAFAATKTIKIGDNWFVRDAGGTQTVTVNKNTTVKWVWTGDDEHNIRASKVPSGETKSRFRASARSTGSFKRKMTVPGTYRLYCSIHDYDDQKMVLKVRS
jgi:plastocyanin